VRRGDRLYGRGAGDDGYAIFAIVTAMEVLQAQGLPHPRLLALIECSEESGSRDLPAYMDRFGQRLGTPGLVVGLDSGCGDYERLWTTTSLRGLVSGNLTVRVLREGVHSGDAGGVVPSSFRILRHCLDRLEDAASGSIVPAELHVEVPEVRRRQAEAAAAILGTALHERLPFLPGMAPAGSDLAELLLARTWRPSLSITAQAGLPPLEQAGNVLRPFTSLKLSLRIPPTLDATAASRRVKEILEAEPPYGADVRFDGEKASQGWEARATAPWLEESLRRASRAYFGKDACAMGEGGSIPFMAMLGARFPGAQFLITGVLGPHANAHGPNEFLHLPTARAITACVASVLADAARTPSAA
jgi:acetylornithine deacetylase/succinyl-diaminopimelate desuccinylase-like protein